MTTQEAREKARGEGFVEFGQEMSVEAMVLLPEFWKSLGKAMGWKKCCEDCGGVTNHCECQISGRGARMIESYIYHWHNLIDHLDSGGTIENYFEEL